MKLLNACMYQTYMTHQYGTTLNTTKQLSSRQIHNVLMDDVACFYVLYFCSLLDISHLLKLNIPKLETLSFFSIQNINHTPIKVGKYFLWNQAQFEHFYNFLFLDMISCFDYRLLWQLSFGDNPTTLVM